MQGHRRPRVDGSRLGGANDGHCRGEHIVLLMLLPLSLVLLSCGCCCCCCCCRQSRCCCCCCCCCCCRCRWCCCRVVVVVVVDSPVDSPVVVAIVVGVVVVWLLAGTHSATDAAVGSGDRCLPACWRLPCSSLSGFVVLASTLPSPKLPSRSSQPITREKMWPAAAQ